MNFITNKSICVSPFGKEKREVEISVRFRPMIDSSEQLAEEIKGLTNPQVITWFLGRKGLRKDWFLYCRDNLINTVRKVAKSSTFFLYNLGKWSNLKSTSIDKKTPTGSKVVKRINSLSCSDIICLDSALYFRFLKECNSLEMVKYANDDMWNRKFIWMKSASFTASGVSIEDSLGKSPLLQAIGNKDVNNAYSGLQYMEGYFLVQEILRRNISTESDELDLVFLLPNDEYRYYYDESRSFEKDVCEMLMKQEDILLNSKISITFIPFQWGKSLNERPYLSDGMPVKGEGLKLLDTLKV